MKMDTDGHLYWAIKNADGTSSFLLDNNGQKVRASGTDGIVPVIGVNRRTKLKTYDPDMDRLLQEYFYEIEIPIHNVVHE